MYKVFQKNQLTIDILDARECVDPGTLVWLQQCLGGTVKANEIEEVAKRLVHKQLYLDVREYLDKIEVAYFMTFMIKYNDLTMTIHGLVKYLGCRITELLCKTWNLFVQSM